MPDLSVQFDNKVEKQVLRIRRSAILPLRFRGASLSIESIHWNNFVLHSFWLLRALITAPDTSSNLKSRRLSQPELSDGQW